MAHEIKVVFGGHSYIRRLRDYTSKHPFNFPNHPIVEQQFCCQGGWKLPDLSQELSWLTDTTVNNSILYLEIGTNDLCNPNLNPLKLSADVVDLCCSLLSRGAAFVLIGEPLPRFGGALLKSRYGNISDFDNARKKGRS